MKTSDLYLTAGLAGLVLIAAAWRKQQTPPAPLPGTTARIDDGMSAWMQWVTDTSLRSSSPLDAAALRARAATNRNSKPAMIDGLIVHHTLDRYMQGGAL